MLLNDARVELADVSILEVPLVEDPDVVDTDVDAGELLSVIDE